MLDFEKFTEALQQRLLLPLPGREAQVKMAPYPVEEKRFREDPDRPAKPSGVMVLLYPHEGEIYLPLMKRPTYPGAHSGQVSFPGGKFEPEDTDFIQTALRETREEIGVAEEQVSLLGSLTELFIIASNFKVYPSVGYVPERPVFLPDPVEVVEVLEVSLTDLRDESKKGIKEMRFGEHVIHSPYFDVQGHVVWGATAMMLSELIHITEKLS